MLRLPLTFHLPLFGFAAFAFLIVCGVLAVAAFLVFKSGAQGETKLGGCAGCAIGFALLVIAGLAAAMCAGVMIVNSKSELLRHGPVRSLELQFGDRDHDNETPAPGAPRADSESTDEGDGKRAERGAEIETSRRADDARHTVHLKLVVHGDEYPAEISTWVREHTEGDVSVTTTRDGDRTIIDFGLPFSSDQLAKLKRDLRESMPDMKLPKSIKIEIKDGDDDE